MGKHGPPTVFGERVRHMRKLHGLTLRQLATRANVEYQHLSRLETGARTNPSLELARRLAVALNVSLDYLSGRYSETELVAAGLAMLATAAQTSRDPMHEWRRILQQG